MGTLLNRIAADLLLPLKDVGKVARGAARCYKVFRIPKRGGDGFRTIAQPTPAVKELQRWAVDHVLCLLPVHDAAMAYRKGKSIQTNAAVHATNQYLLRMDFRNFFNSIGSEDFLLRMQSAGHTFDREDIDYLKRILFWRPDRYSSELILSIGAPSSPAVSNAVMFEFDQIVADICNSCDVSYTRYADDLTFSCMQPDVLRRIENEVYAVTAKLVSPRLTINRDKTHHMSKKGRRTVTGLVVTNEGLPSVGRERKRLIRSMIHHFETGRLADEATAQLKGWIAFIYGVEPEFVRKLNSDALKKLGFPPKMSGDD